MKNERLQKLVTTVAVSAGGLALLAGGLLWWASHWTRTALLAVVTLAPFVVALAFGAGFWFGKTEVRGFLGGFDRALDGLSRAVDRGTMPAFGRRRRPARLTNRRLTCRCTDTGIAS
jgi:hypothetical protein